MVEPVIEARERGVLESSSPSFQRFTKNSLMWADGREEKADAVIFSTGFNPALDHLESLGVTDHSGRISTDGTKATGVKGLWLMGYGNWTGFASATLIGVGRSARKTVEKLTEYVEAVFSEQN